MRTIFILILLLVPQTSLAEFVVLCFTQDGCVPCVRMKPVWKSIEQQRGFKFVYINISRDHAGGEEWGIKITPTTIVGDRNSSGDVTELERLVRFHNRRDTDEFIAKAALNSISKRLKPDPSQGGMRLTGVGITPISISMMLVSLPPFLEVFKYKFTDESTPLQVVQKLESVKCNLCHEGTTKKIRNEYGKALSKYLRKDNYQEARMNSDRVRARFEISQALERVGAEVASDGRTYQENVEEFLKEPE